MAMNNQGNNNTFHLFSHGQPGELLIEGEWKRPIQIKNWIIENEIPLRSKQINIYGFHFAQGKKGKTAASYLETALGVSIAASDDITGIDGDWDLEVGQPIHNLKINSYKHNLALSSLWDKLSNWTASFFEKNEEEAAPLAMSMMMTCGGTVGGTGDGDDFLQNETDIYDT